MRTTHIIFSGVLVLLLSLVYSSAAPRITMVADVPFDFIARNQDFSSGEYKVQVQVLGGGQVLFLKGEGRSLMTLVRSGGSSGEVADEAALIFNRYGNDQHFLSEIQVPGVPVQRIPKCEREKTLVTSTWTARIAINLRPVTETSATGR